MFASLPDPFFLYLSVNILPFLIFFGLLSTYLTGQLKDWTGNGGERERGNDLQQRAAGSLQRGHSLCTRGAHFTSWATSNSVHLLLLLYSANYPFCFTMTVSHHKVEKDAFMSTSSVYTQPLFLTPTCLLFSCQIFLNPSLTSFHPCCCRTGLQKPGADAQDSVPGGATQSEICSLPYPVWHRGCDMMPHWPVRV